MRHSVAFHEARGFHVLMHTLMSTEGASAIRVSIEAVYLDFDLDTLYTDRTKSLLVQN
jgi:hypothetical protein